MNEGVRFHFAVGDFITRFPAGSQHVLRIDTQSEKPGWQTRTLSLNGDAEFPGSAILFEGEYYEIVRRDWEMLPDYRVCYYLNAWEDRFPIRTQFSYSVEGCRKSAALRRERVHSNRMNILLWILMPLVGMLPAEDQQTLANKYGLSAVRLTYVSALLLFIPAGFCLVRLIAYALGSPLPGPESLHWLYLIGLYFIPESLARMYTSARLEEPIGSLPVSAPVNLFRGIIRNFSTADRQKRFESMEVSGSQQTALLHTLDVVMEVKSDTHDLEVTSLLPKNHWNPARGIQYRDTWYGVVESAQIQEGKELRYKYSLRKAPEGTWFRDTCIYDVDEVQKLFREKRLRDLSTWVDTFSLLWGLLETSDQKRLEELYQYDSLKFTRWTAAALGILGLANIFASVSNLVSGIGRPLDLVLLFAAAYFLLESCIRIQRASAGIPSGSVLGSLVRPFAIRLLRPY